MRDITHSKPFDKKSWEYLRYFKSSVGYLGLNKKLDIFKRWRIDKSKLRHDFQLLTLTSQWATNQAHKTIPLFMKKKKTYCITIMVISWLLNQLLLFRSFILLEADGVSNCFVCRMHIHVHGEILRLKSANYGFLFS